MWTAMLSITDLKAESRGWECNNCDGTWSLLQLKTGTEKFNSATAVSGYSMELATNTTNTIDIKPVNDAPERSKANQFQI